MKTDNEKTTPAAPMGAPTPALPPTGATPGSESSENEHEYIYELNVQSLTITPYTQYQNKLLLRMFVYFQDDIRNAIFEQLQEGGHIRFTPAEMSERMRHREIPLCQLEPNRGHYQRTREELTKMAQLPVYIPYRKWGGKGPVEYAGFARLFAVDFGKKGNKTMVQLRLSTDLLHYYLNASLGYHRLDLTEAMRFRLNATRSMYRLYYGHFAFAKSHMKVVQLGCLLSKKMNFANCAEIIKTLLHPAKEEMDAAFYAGMSQIHFDYTVRQPDEAPAASKDKREEGNEADASQTADEEAVAARASLQRMVVLTFYTQEDAHPTGQRKHDLEQFQARLRVTLKHCWGVHEKVAHDISQKVEVWMLPTLDELLARKRDFANKMKDKRTPIRNEAGFIVKQLGKYLEEHTQHKQRMDQKGTKGCPGNANGSLF